LKPEGPLGQGGDDDTGLRVTKPPASAAGVTGVMAAARQAMAEMGARRTLATLRLVNQVGGFDCPGCAWPEPDNERRSHLEFCENGAKAVAEEATRSRVTSEFFAAHPLSDLSARTDHWLGKQGRLTTPMVKDEGADHYRPISWDDAFELIADELGALPSPDAAVFYTSGRTSNEAAYLYQLLVRRFGTNNLPDCSNMCHESSGAALTEAIGVGKGSVTLDDFELADLILVVGQNPGTNHPRMLTTLEAAKRRGARIVAVNPLPEPGLLRFKNPQAPRGTLGSGTALADLHVPIRVNGDLALFQAVNRRLLAADEADPAAGIVDHGFVERHCDGLDALVRHLRELDQDDVAAATGLTAAEIDAVAAEIARSQRMIVCWAMGLTQHRNSVATIREIANLALLTGNIGKPGAGLCPVRGHSNVQGDRTMGIWERPTTAFLDGLAAEHRFEPPRHHGLDTVGAIRAMRDGEVKVFFGLGGNFAAASPDTGVTEAALRRCRLTVHVSTKLNRSHVVTGERALILPTLGRTETDRQDSGEQFVTVEDSMGAVHASQGRLEPASPELRSEVAIVCELARRVLGNDDLDGEWSAMEADYGRVREHIARVVPGFDDFNLKVAVPGGFTLPHAPRDARQFPTASGKAQLTVNRLEVVRTPPGRLLLQTVRSHDQYNTTIYGLDDRYRGIRHGRRVVFVNERDAVDLGLADGDIVDLVSEHQTGERRAPAFRVVHFATPRGCCAAYFPEANALVPLESVADVSGTPTSKSIVVRLEPRH
jgi:molybdopterin-dependent oxidoreductase alpha subunit